MNPAGFKTTKPRNSTHHRSGLSVSVARANSYPVSWAPNGFGLSWKEKKRQRSSRENRSEDAAQPLISNRQLSVDFETLLRAAASVMGNRTQFGAAFILNHRRIFSDQNLRLIACIIGLKSAKPHKTRIKRTFKPLLPPRPTASLRN